MKTETAQSLTDLVARLNHHLRRSIFPSRTDRGADAAVYHAARIAAGAELIEFLTSRPDGEALAQIVLGLSCADCYAHEHLTAALQALLGDDFARLDAIARRSGVQLA